MKTASEKPFDPHSLPLSDSVQGAIRGVLPDEKIPAWQIVAGIIKPHPEYAGGLGGKLGNESGPAGGDGKAVRALPICGNWGRRRAVRDGCTDTGDQSWVIVGRDSLGT